MFMAAALLHKQTSALQLFCGGPYLGVQGVVGEVEGGDDGVGGQRVAQRLRAQPAQLAVRHVGLRAAQLLHHLQVAAEGAPQGRMCTHGTVAPQPRERAGHIPCMHGSWPHLPGSIKTSTKQLPLCQGIFPKAHLGGGHHSQLIALEHINGRALRLVAAAALDVHAVAHKQVVPALWSRRWVTECVESWQRLG